MTAISKRNECTALGDTLDDEMMNRAANYVEATASALGLGLRIHGGRCYRQNRTLELHAQMADGVRDNVASCRQLHERLRQAFNAENAGIDADHDIVWILRMTEVSNE